MGDKGNDKGNGGLHLVNGSGTGANTAPDTSPSVPDWKEFVVPASDTKGHNEKIWFRIQPGHSKALSEAAGSRSLPYRTRADVIRHAISRHLKWLDEECGHVSSVTALVDSINEIVRDTQFMVEYKSSFDDLSNVVSRLMCERAYGEARRMVYKIRADILRLPPGYWQDKYLKELGERFGHILSSKDNDNHL